MNFGHWLVTPQGIPLLIALVGLGGTVATATVSVITQRSIANANAEREDRRFAYEKARNEAAARGADRARFENVKREAFTRHLNNANRLNRFLREQDRVSRAEKLLGRDPYEMHILKFVDIYTASGEEIILIAPELTEQVRRVSDLLVGSAPTNPRKKYGVDTEERAYLEIANLRRLMQKSLGIDPVEVKSYQNQLNETNPLEKPKPIQL